MFNLYIYVCIYNQQKCNILRYTIIYFSIISYFQVPSEGRRVCTYTPILKTTQRIYIIPFYICEFTLIS